MVRKRQARNIQTMAFCLNSYNVVVNRRDKDDEKLYLDGYKGLRDSDLFNQSKFRYKVLHNF